MKLSTLEKAASLYNKWQCEQNSDTRVPHDTVRDDYKNFCKDNGLTEKDAELFAMANYCYGAYIEQQLNRAKLEAMSFALNDIAAKMDKENHPDSTRLFELSAKLEA